MYFVSLLVPFPVFFFSFHFFYFFAKYMRLVMPSIGNIIWGMLWHPAIIEIWTYQSALQAKPMHIISVVLILDTWEICLVKFFGPVFVYKILSKSPMYHKSEQHRQYTLVLPVAPIVKSLILNPILIIPNLTTLIPIPPISSEHFYISVDSTLVKNSNQKLRLL